MHATSLDAKVAARNRANAYTNELHARLAEIFRPLVGTKVRKADGTLTAKIAAMMPEMPCDPGLRVYRLGSTYSLTWEVKARETHAGRDCEFANYQTAAFSVGSIQDGVLVELAEPSTRRTDYDADKIRAARKAHEEAKAAVGRAYDALERAYDALDGFGEYDD